MKVSKAVLVALTMGGLAYGVTGEHIYKMRCGGCHGLDGKANTTIGKDLQMRDLTSPEVQKQTDAQLTRTIANGVGRMPSYELILGPERIQTVIGYIREMGK
jgi:mono/diheme cytochrome c family protein